MDIIAYRTVPYCTEHTALWKWPNRDLEGIVLSIWITIPCHFFQNTIEIEVIWVWYELQVTQSKLTFGHVWQLILEMSQYPVVYDPKMPVFVKSHCYMNWWIRLTSHETWVRISFHVWIMFSEYCHHQWWALTCPGLTLGPMEGMDASFIPGDWWFINLTSNAEQGWICSNKSLAGHPRKHTDEESRREWQIGNTWGWKNCFWTYLCFYESMVTKQTTCLVTF